MQTVDAFVVIAGGGPAGLQCARDLNIKGYKTLLLEHSSTPGMPNYSTGWTPSKTIDLFNLSNEAIGDSFKNVTIASPNEQSTWKYDEPVGYVLKFDGLKIFLAREVENYGSTVLYGANVEGVEFKADGSIESINFTKGKDEFCVKAKYFVDATGSRAVLANKVHLTKKTFPSIGLEKIIETDTIRGLENRIAIYFGRKFIPHGYAWVSCFGVNKYKIGVCIADRGFFKENVDEEHYLSTFLNILGITNYKQTEEHGGTIFCNGGYKHNVFKNMIMVGDTGSCINPLAGEGVRHALQSGRFAAETIDACEKGQISDLTEYDNKLTAYRGRRWKLSRLFATVLYHKFNDTAHDIFVRKLGKLTPKELDDLGYNYNYLLLIKAFLRR